MKKYIDYFLSYLQTEKDASPKTIHKYKSDLNRLLSYLLLHYNITDLNKTETNHLRQYLSEIKNKNRYSSSTISNKIHIIKHFF